MNDNQELVECIENLMGFVDTPIGRRKFPGKDFDEVRKEARGLIKKYKNNIKSDDDIMKYAIEYGNASQFKSDFPHHKESCIDGFYNGFKTALGKIDTPLDKLNKLAVTTSNWVEEAKYRQENLVWLQQTQKVAIRILRIMRLQNISRTEMSYQLNIDLTDFSQLLKGVLHLSDEVKTSIVEKLNEKYP